MIVKFVAPTVADTEPFGLKFSVVSALTVTVEPDSGTVEPTFAYVVPLGKF